MAISTGEQSCRPTSCNIPPHLQKAWGALSLQLAEPDEQQLDTESCPASQASRDAAQGILLQALEDMRADAQAGLQRAQGPDSSMGCLGLRGHGARGRPVRILVA